jgi:uncharacterized protein (DUF924 family)
LDDHNPSRQIATTDDPERLLSFWFGAPDHPEYHVGRQVWFRPRLDFDRACESFLDHHEAALAGRLDHWANAPRSCLALIVALDQLPRNLFRNDPRSYAADDKALAVARHAVARGFDRTLRGAERSFVYLPYEHSEDLAVQRACVVLMGRLGYHPGGARALNSAVRHLRIVERFGRFPHRNEILGRPSTPEEVEFLTQPGSTFLRTPEA